MLQWIFKTQKDAQKHFERRFSTLADPVPACVDKFGDIPHRRLGVRVVFDIPDQMMPIVNQPPGRVRFRFRNNRIGSAFILHAGVARHFAIGVISPYCESPSQPDGPVGHWFLIEQGRNVKA